MSWFCVDLVIARLPLSKISSKSFELLLSLSLFAIFYSTAGRMIKTGLTASVIVSQWTWAATLLQSSNTAWQYGVSGPFWYVQYNNILHFVLLKRGDTTNGRRTFCLDFRTLSLCYHLSLSIYLNSKQVRFGCNHSSLALWCAGH